MIIAHPYMRQILSVKPTHPTLLTIVIYMWTTVVVQGTTQTVQATWRRLGIFTHVVCHITCEEISFRVALQ